MSLFINYHANGGPNLAYLPQVAAGQSDLAVDAAAMDVFLALAWLSHYTRCFDVVFAVKKAGPMAPVRNLVYPLDSSTWAWSAGSILPLALVCTILASRGGDRDLVVRLQGLPFSLMQQKAVLSSAENRPEPAPDGVGASPSRSTTPGGGGASPGWPC